MDVEEIISKILNKFLKKKFPYLVQGFFKLRDIPIENLNAELEIFQEDLKNYGLGVLLWLDGRYPSVVLMYSMLGFNFNNMNLRSNMRLVVNEYYKFLADVRGENQLELFNNEMDTSKEMIFANEVQPKDLSSKDVYVNYLRERYTKNIQALAPQIKAYSEILTSEIKEFENFDMKNLIKVLFFILKIKRIKKRSMPTLNEITADVYEMTEEAKRIYNENLSIAYNMLTLISSIDSFNIDFAKFVARLFKIKSKGNGNVKYEPFIQINPKQYDPKTRKKLKNFLDLTMKSEYPKLSAYIRSMFNYNKYRILEAHKNPKVRKVCDGKAYFMRTGKADLVMDLNEIMRETKTYEYFIDSLHLF